MPSGGMGRVRSPEAISGTSVWQAGQRTEPGPCPKVWLLSHWCPHGHRSQRAMVNGPLPTPERSKSSLAAHTVKGSMIGPAARIGGDCTPACWETQQPPRAVLYQVAAI